MNASANFRPDAHFPLSHTPPNLSAKDLASLIQSGRPYRILDVRTPAEYESAHIEPSVLRPLGDLVAAEWIQTGGTSALYLLCQTGGRATKAAALLTKAGVPCTVIEGGLEAWVAAGLPVVRGKSRVLPLMRQVQIVIGLVTATGSALAVWKHPLFGFIPMAMGVGLIFAGVSGICGLALLMARMPWNRTSQGSGSSTQKATPAASCCSTPDSNEQ